MASWRGMSLIEVVISLGILAVIFVCVVALFAALIDSTAKTANMSVGVQLAEQKLEEAIREDNYWPLPADASQGIYVTDDQNQTTFWYRLDATPVSASAAPMYTGGYLLECEVWWWSTDPSQADRAGQGKLSTSIRRFHYPNGALVP